MTVKLDELLRESTTLSEEAKSLIREAWENNLSEAKSKVTSELREEFAQKFEHDKGVLLEAMDKFLTDRVTKEMDEFAEDKKNLVSERVAVKAKLAEHVKKLDEFVMSRLAAEIAELRKDKMSLTEGIYKLENFVLKQLSEEIKELRTDKKALVEQKVKLVSEGKKQLFESKKEFVEKAAVVVEKTIDDIIRKEISQFREDIKSARENAFGRKIFEAYATEFMASYLNDGSQVSKIQNELEVKEEKIKALETKINEQAQLTESVKIELSAANDRVGREKILNELFAPLGKEKRAIMEDLLQTVKTKNLRESFNKYLPAVLNETAGVRKDTATKVLNESARTEKTGNRAPTDDAPAEGGEIIRIQKLAGIK